MTAATEPDDQPHVLDVVEAFMRRFVAFPSESAVVASVLWAAHAHLLDCFDSTPRMAYLSPEPESGKTRALEILATLVPHAVHAADVTTPALFRSIGDADKRITLLFDEIDTVFGPKAQDHEDLRGLINAGHRRSGTVLRCVGDGANQQVVEFPTFAAVALAGLGELPDTILSRSVIVRMRRRAPGETVESFRERIHIPQGHQLRDALAEWADLVRADLGETFPEMPDGINDRPADVWEPLLMVADAAGGAWPQRGRAACVELVQAIRDPAKVSLGVRLLADLRTVFGTADRMPTTAILAALSELDGAPWGELVRGNPIDSRRLSRMLGKYTTDEGEPIKPRNVRMPDGTTPKGYLADDLADAWTRYLPPLASQPGSAEELRGGRVADGGPVSATASTPPDLQGGGSVADVADVADFPARRGESTSTPGLEVVPSAPVDTVESGTCWVCQQHFRRAIATNHPTVCTTCARWPRAAG